MPKEPKVLLVDDDDNFAQLVNTKFALENIPLWRASGGEEGLALLEKGQVPDLILLDIDMPGIDGFETLKRIKRNPAIADIPVVIMSNFSREEDIEWGKKLGAKKFVEKVSMVPSDIVELVRAEAKKNR